MDFSGRDVIHEYSKNRTCDPSPISNLPSERNSPKASPKLRVSRHVLSLSQSFAP
jgi:hypothetical protein